MSGMALFRGTLAVLLTVLITPASFPAVVAIENAKVATLTSLGTIETGAVHVTDGVISWVGPAADAPALGADAQRIDAQGRWVTPGLSKAIPGWALLKSTGKRPVRTCEWKSTQWVPHLMCVTRSTQRRSCCP